MASDDGRTYIGLNYAQLDDSDLDPAALQLKIGHFFNDYVAIEGRAAFGVGDETGNIDGLSASAEVENYYGIYVKAQYPVNDHFKPYIAAGYSHVEVDVTVRYFGDEYSGSASDSGFSYMLGADIDVTDSFGFNLEYGRLIDSSDGELDLISGGVHYKF